MERQERIDAGALLEEIDRYLAAVDVFRANGCEPTWRPETSSATMWPEPAITVTAGARSAH